MPSRPCGLIASLILHAAPQRNAGRGTTQLRQKRTSREGPLLAYTAAVRVMGGYGMAVPAEALVVDLGDGPKFVRRGRAKAEEFEICRNLFKQHIGADLNFTATRPCGRQKWRDFLFHHDFADER